MVSMKWVLTLSCGHPKDYVFNPDAPLQRVVMTGDYVKCNHCGSESRVTGMVG